MKNFTKKASLVLVGALIGGAVVGASGYYGVTGSMMAVAEQPAENTKAGEPEPLYWVAPMDPNYRRDKPGKSPMGMDLIPVYEEGVGNGPDAGPGTIEIKSEVVNNLGVRTAAASFESLVFDIRTVGYVGYNQDATVHINPRVEGWIEKLHVKSTGEPVEDGQPLYDLYSPELVNAQEELLFAIKQGDRRMQRASEARLESLNVDAKTLAEIKRDRKVRQTITFHAPMAGVVDDFSVREGGFVKPGSALMSITSLDEVWVEAKVLERQASLVQVGQKVRMTMDYEPGREWEGAIDYIYPTLDPKTRALKVRVRFDNPNQAIKPEMFATLRIEAEDNTPVLSVPREAVIRGGETDRVVLALGDGRFKSIKVTTGRSDGKRMEILEGLNDGDVVATSAQFLLDSESSKTSDFKRMESASNDMAAMKGHGGMEKKEVKVKKVKPTKASVEATINKLMPEQRKMNVDHGPIPEWKWPSMTMDFNLAESVDIERLEAGLAVQLEIAKRESGGYEVIKITPQSGTSMSNHDMMDHNSGMPGMKEVNHD